MADVIFTKGLEENKDKPTKIEGQILFTTNQGRIYLDTSSTQRVQLYEKDFDALKGSASDNKDSTSIAGAKKYTDNAITNLKQIAKTGNASDVNIADTGNKITATNVEGALAELATNISSTTTGGKVTITEDTTNTTAAKSYKIFQGGTGTENLVGTINIPKDMVVKSGTVVKNPSGQAAGTYLALTLANATNDTIYINVTDFIEQTTSGSTDSDMVRITVTDHAIAASITDNSITNAKIKDNTIANAKIAEGAITNAKIADDAAIVKTKLESDVQTSLGKADTAVQPSEFNMSETSGQYIAGFTVANDAAKTISPIKVQLPVLTWRTF